MLAERLGVGFVDLDDVVCASMGVADAGEAFARFGEGAFRLAETRALVDVLEGGGAGVVALGGGTPTAPGAVGVLTDFALGGGCVVYLRTLPAELSARLRAVGESGNRPSLTGLDPAAEVERVFRARDALYRVVATWVVFGGGVGEVLEGVEGEARGHLGT